MLPTDDLEIKAADERLRIESSLQELKSRVKESANLERVVRRHILAVSAATSMVSLAIGFYFAGTVLSE